MIGTTVSHYRIVRQLGAGGMGVVYLAEDLRLHRKVALKFLSAEIAADAQSRARFEREAQAASALDHPHIATVYEIGESDNRPFIAMAYCDGETLKDRIARGPMPISEATSIGAQIAAALKAAHAEGIVHRDLKPANIMLQAARGPTPARGQTATASGDSPPRVSEGVVVKVVDFGLAKVTANDQETAARMTAAGTTLGTVAYMSPEQVRGEDVDQRADVWSLGVVLYEMLTGRLPFSGANSWAIMRAAVEDAPAPIQAQRPDAPAEVLQLIDRALTKDRAARTLSAADMEAELGASHLRASSSGLGATPLPPVPKPRRRARVLIPVAVLLVIAALPLGWWLNRSAKIRWAREEALPEILRLSEREEYVQAFDLAIEAERYIPGDRLLSAQWPNIARSASVTTTPPGAEVRYRPYAAQDGPWRQLGTTPIQSARMPRGFYQWRIEKDGYVPVDDVGPWPFGATVELAFSLDAAGVAPPDMVRVSTAGTPFTVFIPGLDHLPPVELRDFWIDRHEVTNRQFKRFLDEGGYRRRDLWRHEFVKDGRRLSWEQAIPLFRDGTGRPGPATWELGSYPEAQGDHPVTGVSWYEAAAYAAFAGKALPTIFHWSRAADQRLAGDIVPRSNFGGRGALPVGQSQSMNRFGTFDMAGNVKEWCWNDAPGGQRYILGGAWNEPVYMFTDAYAHSPFSREPTFGFRCVKLPPEDRLTDAVSGLIDVPSRDYSREKPVSDEVFRAYAGLYAYDRTVLSPKVESVDDSNDDWTREKVTFSSAYGTERVIAHLFLPKRARPPFQTVVFFPGSNALNARSSDRDINPRLFDFIVKSGRAFLFPVYKSTFERGDEVRSDYPNETAAWRDHVIMWGKDLRRSIDYLETRDDIARDRVAFVGFSWGAVMGAHLLALEPRMKAAVLWVGGFYLQKALPEADTINFASRVKIPVLMLNGRYDFFYPTEASQLPLFRLLGTPPEHKRHLLYEAAHALPRNELIKETLNWLDRYVGPVP